MADVKEIPHTRHPNCHCSDVPDEEMDSLTLQMANEVRDMVMASCGVLDLCDRSAVMVLVFAMHSTLSWHGFSDERVDEEIAEAMRVFREHREVSREVMQAMREAPPPSSQN